MKVVIALGGNALLQRGEPPDAEIQEAHILAAARGIAPLAREHELVITHGNGPQVGLLALENEHEPSLSRPYPFDALGAQTQGLIGYWLVQALHNVAELAAACVVCRTVVRADDPAFARPTKFVGPIYDTATARRLAGERGWQVRADGGSWRRVVASPEPVEVLELPVVRLLSRHGTVVVCAGGGGIPVRRDVKGRLRGVEAVVDKDLTASLLARALGSDALLLLTDVDAVYDHYGTNQATPIRRITGDELRSRTFASGSMGPKVEAACRFTEGGGLAVIGRLDDAQRLLHGECGTTVT